MNDTVNSATEFHGKMNVLHEAGLIKQHEDGSLLVVDDIEERAQLKEQISSKKRPHVDQINPGRRQAMNFGQVEESEQMYEDDSTVF